MEKSEKSLKFVKMASLASSAVAAAIAGVASCFASSGISLTSAVITGANAGLTDSAGSITDTVNNQYLVEFALMFIGFAVAVGVIMYFVKGHRRI